MVPSRVPTLSTKDSTICWLCCQRDLERALLHFSPLRRVTRSITTKDTFKNLSIRRNPPPIKLSDQRRNPGRTRPVPKPTTLADLGTRIKADPRHLGKKLCNPPFQVFRRLAQAEHQTQLYLQLPRLLNLLQPLALPRRKVQRVVSRYLGLLLRPRGSQHHGFRCLLQDLLQWPSLLPARRKETA